jgi:di/tricarboxylate transporter
VLPDDRPEAAIFEFTPPLTWVRVILVVIFAFGVSEAMYNDHTQVARWMAHIVVDTFAPLGPTGVFFGVCLIACLVGSVVSNNASALLLYRLRPSSARGSERPCLY